MSKTHVFPHITSVRDDELLEIGSGLFAARRGELVPMSPIAAAMADPRRMKTIGRLMREAQAMGYWHHDDNAPINMRELETAFRGKDPQRRIKWKGEAHLVGLIP